MVILLWVALFAGILLVVYGVIVGGSPLGISPSVAIGGVLAFLSNYYLQRETARSQRETEEVSANAQAQDATIAAYTEKMSELVLEKDFRKASNDAQAPKVAQALTITTLVQLDSERKRIVLKVVYTLGLIRRDPLGSEPPLLELEGATLNHADLTEFRLRDASLRGADLRGTALQGADLSGSDLSYADLRGVNLTNADLSDANLSGANLLPYDEQYPARLSFYNLKGHALPSYDYLRSLAKHRSAELKGLRGLRGRLTRSLRNRLLSRKPITFTKLTDTKLVDANLTGAILANADLRDIRGLSREQVERAIGNSETLLPDADELARPLTSPETWSDGIEAQIKEFEEQIKKLPSE